MNTAIKLGQVILSVISTILLILGAIGLITEIPEPSNMTILLFIMSFMLRYMEDRLE